MPISADNKKRYPPNWREIRDRILDRDEHRCKQCTVPNNALIVRGEDGDAGTYMLPDGDVHDEKTGEKIGRARGSEYDGRFVRVVLTVAHLDHVIENNSDENLAALCQRCHLAHDLEQHQENARRTRRAQKASGELFDLPPARRKDQHGPDQE